MQGNTEQQLVEGLSIAVKQVTEVFKQFTQAVTNAEVKAAVSEPRPEPEVLHPPVTEPDPEVEEPTPRRRAKVKLKKADPKSSKRKVGGKRLPRGFWKSGGRNRKIARRNIKLDAHTVSISWIKKDPLNYPCYCLKVALIMCHDMRDYDNVHPSPMGNSKYLVTSLVGLSRVLVGKDNSGSYSKKVKPFFEIACLEGEATLAVDLPDGIGWFVLSIKKDQVSIALVSDVPSIRSQWDQIQARFIGSKMKEFKKGYPKVKTLVIRASETDDHGKVVTLVTNGGNGPAEEVALQ